MADARYYLKEDPSPETDEHGRTIDIVTLEGPCSNCGQPESSLIMMSIKKLTPIKRKIYLECVACNQKMVITMTKPVST